MRNLFARMTGLLGSMARVLLGAGARLIKFAVTVAIWLLRDILPQAGSILAQALMRPRTRLFILTAILVVLVMGLGWTGYRYLFPQQPLALWTMVDVSGTHSLSDAHLIELPNGRKALIDTARFANAEKYLIPFLETRGIKRLERVILTNPLFSKTGGLEALLQSDIEIGAINYNPVSRVFCEQVPGRCNHQELESIVQSWNRQVPVWPMQSGQVLMEGESASLKVLFSHDGIINPPSKPRFRDVTSILLLSAGDNRVLFASDLSASVGDLLLDNHGKITGINLLKVPYHGLDSGLSESLIEAIKPGLEAVFIPGVQSVWNSRRSLRTRALLGDIRSYINDRDGNVEVRLYDKNFEVEGRNHPDYSGQSESDNETGS